jgi:hypothetical protein
MSPIIPFTFGIHSITAATRSDALAASDGFSQHPVRGVASDQFAVRQADFRSEIRPLDVDMGGFSSWKTRPEQMNGVKCREAGQSRLWSCQWLESHPPATKRRDGSDNDSIYAGDMTMTDSSVI